MVKFCTNRILVEFLGDQIDSLGVDIVSVSQYVVECTRNGKEIDFIDYLMRESSKTRSASRSQMKPKFEERMSLISTDFVDRMKKYNKETWKEQKNRNDAYFIQTTGVCNGGCANPQNKFLCSILRKNTSSYSLKKSEGINHVKGLHPNAYEWYKELSKIYIKFTLNLC